MNGRILDPHCTTKCFLESFARQKDQILHRLSPFATGCPCQNIILQFFAVAATSKDKPLSLPLLSKAIFGIFTLLLIVKLTSQHGNYLLSTHCLHFSLAKCNSNVQPT